MKEGIENVRTRDLKKTKQFWRKKREQNRTCNDRGKKE